MWDPVKKKWTNKDGDDNDAVAAPPPPTDNDLMSMLYPLCTDDDE